MRIIRKNIYKLTLIILVLSIILVVIIKCELNNNKVIAINTTEIENKEVKEEQNKHSEVIKNMYADIKGEVINPGLYKIDDNNRVMDIIIKAGGLTENANTTLINLAMKVFDEMVIVIYSNTQIDNLLLKDKKLIYECKCPDLINDACVSEKVNTPNKIEKASNINSNVSNDNNNENSNELAVNDIININAASKEELMTLSGIGESKALAIIEYRNLNGSFNIKEDILNVSGIGESIYEKIKDSITT